MSIPDWVPEAVATMGLELIAGFNPMRHLNPRYGYAAEACRRLITDESMENVWPILLRQHPDRSFQHPTNGDTVTALLSTIGTKGVSQQGDAGCIQQKALALLLRQAVLYLTYEPTERAAPTARTVSEIEEDYKSIEAAAAAVERAMAKLAFLGQPYLAGLQDTVLAARRYVAQERAMAGCDPLVVKRQGRAWKGPFQRGYVLNLASFMQNLFGSVMPGITANIVRVALEIDVSEATIRGATLGLDS